jgi:hypothetical protein
VASVTIARDAGYADSVREYSILLDGLFLGEVGEAEVKTFPIEPGEHRIEAKIDWCGSRLIKFTASPNADITFIVKSNLRGAKVALALFYILAARRSYLALRQVPDLAGFVAQPQPIETDWKPFVLKSGVLGFGLGAFALSQFVDYFLDDRIPTLPRLLFALVVWLIAGALWGMVMWRWRRRRFGAQMEAHNARLAQRKTSPES